MNESVQRFAIRVGDIWGFPATYRVITTNGIVKRNGSAVMGRGIARDAAEKYPDLPFELGRKILEERNHVYKLSHGVIAYPTKYDWKDKADPLLIQESARELMNLLSKDETAVIPQPGCVNGGLDWKLVRGLLTPIFDKRITVLIPPPQPSPSLMDTISSATGGTGNG